jgi:hypothetical protein
VFGNLYPFQDVPGLLTPAMNDNVRSQALLSAGAGLMKSAGWSKTPVNMWEALGNGLQGGLQGYSGAMSEATKQALAREQVQKAEQEREQLVRWQAIMGGLGTMPGATPQQPAMPPAPQGDSAAGGTVPPEVVAALSTAGTTPAPAPASPVTGSPVTQRRGPETGMLSDALAKMPPALRHVIALQGPERGAATLATWLGKTPDKPSDTFLTVRDADGNLKPYRADSPELDRAIAAGGLVVTTPTSTEPRASDLITLELDGVRRTLRKTDPLVDGLLKQGYEQVTTRSSNSRDRAPENYIIPNEDGTRQVVLSADGQTYKAADGSLKKLPFGSFKQGSENAAEAVRQNEVSNRAQTSLNNTPAASARPAAEGPTRVGTGPWSNVQAGLNAALGDATYHLFNKDGLFRETQANRDYLRQIAQFGKAALVNNPRFPVAEQEIVGTLLPNPDQFWANPRTEAQKIPLLRNTLNEQLRTHNEELAKGGLTKEHVSEIQRKKTQIEQAIRLLGPGDASLGALGGGDQPKEPEPKKRPVHIDDVPPGVPFIQKGQRFMKRPDGTIQHLGPVR